MPYKIDNRHLLLLLIFYSVCALAFAYFSEYFLGYFPCKLCLYQRWIFFGIIFLATIPFLKISFLNKDIFEKVALFACIFLIGINCLVAAYHVGVEQKFFDLPKSCEAGNFEVSEDFEEFKNSVLKQNAVRCDKPSFVFLGISMAGWNFGYCLFLAGATLMIIYRKKDF